MILVLGGGFGLYGHLAALARMGRSVGTLARYRATIEARPELRDLVPALTWYDDDDQGFADAEAVVLARRPRDNAVLAERLVGLGWSGHLVIEKPMAETADAAGLLADRLRARNGQWSVPYLFQHCDWYPPLAARIASPDGAIAKIGWSFRQAPQLRAWKRSPDEGGGALAFYFIHCLALVEAAIPAADCAFTDSECGSEGRRLGISGRKGRASMAVEFTLNCGQPEFMVGLDGSTVVRSENPFGPRPLPGVIDPRVSILQRFYTDSVFGTQRQTPAYHARVLSHWKRLEMLHRCA